MMTLDVLLIDDERAARLRTSTALLAEGCQVRAVSTLGHARAALGEAVPDVVLLDRRLPDGDGMAFLREQHGLGQAPIVMMAASDGAAEDEVVARRDGAAGYLTKPLQLAGLIARLEALVSARRLRAHFALARHHGASLPHVALHSAARREVYRRLGELAATPRATALFVGCAGVGKRTLAERLHAASQPADAPAPLIVAELANDDAEGELFGYERAARLERRGLLELADGGTLLLDEIGELSLRGQAKLMTFLRDGRFRRVGSQRERQARLRVVATSHRDLDAMVGKGHFRVDLQRTLAAGIVAVPPLCAGPEDIAPLADAFVRFFAARIKKVVTGISAGAHRVLRRYDFPGNIRELRAVIEHGVILAGGRELSERDIVLPATASAPDSGFFAVGLADSGRPLPLRQVEQQYVARVLRHYDSHRTEAALALGISYPTFIKRLRELGIADADSRGRVVRSA